MTPLDITNLRLRNQQITSTSRRTQAELVGWFGAMQTQDYTAAK